jgi:biopolymer transport protein TolR
MAGGAAPQRRGKRRLTAEINVVPYIDVMLVLLVIFMVTAPLLTQGVDVQLPQVNSEPIVNNEEPVTLSVDARGQYYLDIGTNRDKPLVDDEVVQRIRAVVNNKPQTMILLRADRAVPYDRVANGLSLLQAAGAKKIGFVTESPGANSGNRKPKRG